MRADCTDNWSSPGQILLPKQALSPMSGKHSRCSCSLRTLTMSFALDTLAKNIPCKWLYSNAIAKTISIHKISMKKVFEIKLHFTTLYDVFSLGLDCFNCSLMLAVKRKNKTIFDLLGSPELNSEFFPNTHKKVLSVFSSHKLSRKTQSLLDCKWTILGP